MDLEFISHLSCKEEHILLQRVVGTEILCETVTSFAANGEPSKTKKPKRFWYHKDDKKTHGSFDNAVLFNRGADVQRASVAEK